MLYPSGLCTHNLHCCCFTDNNQEGDDKTEQRYNTEMYAPSDVFWYVFVFVWKYTDDYRYKTIQYNMIFHMYIMGLK